tara:strand:+ start:478 stop:879 length:402 start_codon:yes stop_codon:yes gene_type:complete
MIFIIKNNLLRLMRHDDIRFLKLLEIIQYASLASLLSLGISHIINKYTPELDKTKGKSIILLEVLFQLILLIIIAYYIKKFVEIFPFIGAGLSSKYVPSKKNEANVGVEFGLAYIFVASQIKLNEKITYLVSN